MAGDGGRSQGPGRRGSGKARPLVARSAAVRVKGAGRRKRSSTEWLSRQLNDPYVAEAQRLGYRSRSAFKLIELDDRFGLLSPGRRSWTAVDGRNGMNQPALTPGWIPVAAATGPR